MGTSAGPSLQGIGRGGDSNLVLEMDAHDAKSYPGEPTSNLLDNPIVTWTDNAAVTATSNVSYGGQTFTRKCVNTATGASSPGLFPVGIQMTASASTVYTFSLRGFKDVTTGGGNVYLYVQNYTGSWGDMVWPGAAFPNEDEYFADPSNEIVSSTFTTPVSTTLIRVGILFAGMSTTGGIFYVKDLQVEEKGYATPFVREGNGGTGTYNARPASVNLSLNDGSYEDKSPEKLTLAQQQNMAMPGFGGKFGGAAYYFDGTSFLKYTTSSSALFGTGPYTVDFWHYMPAGTSLKHYATWFSTYTSTYTDGVIIARYSTADRYGIWTNNGGWIDSGVNLLTDQWAHVAVVRKSTATGDTTYYLNGTAIGAAITDATDYDTPDTPEFILGSLYTAGDSYGLEGYMSDVRVCTGTELWTSNFTPPTRRNLSAPVVDRSGNYNGGNFVTTDMTDVTTYRVGEVIRPIDSAVWDFDGTDDEINMGHAGGAFIKDGVDRTIAQWVVSPTATATYMSSLGYRKSADETGGWMIYWRQGYIRIWFNGGTNSLEVAGNAFAANTIYYVVATWPSGSGNTVKLYINGEYISAADGITGISADSTSNELSIGRYGANSGFHYTGKVYNTQIYDTVLTDQQVVENFNQQRNRFKI